MTGSYKMVLIAAAALFLFVVGYYVFQDSSQPDRPGVASEPSQTSKPQASAPSPSAPKPTLASAPKPARPAADAPRPSPSQPLASNADRMAALRAKLARAKTAAPPSPSLKSTSATSSSPPTLVLDGKKSPQPSAAAAAPTPKTSTPTPSIGPTRSAGTTTATTTTAQPPSPKPQANPTASAPASYTVKAGDTLSSIAQDLYGSDRRWVDIAQANPTVDPIKLKVGQVLKLPPANQLQETDSPRAPAPGATVIYTVRPGDTLSSIAQQYYSQPTRWRIIFNANHDQLGANPDSIQAGMKLKIPPSPEPAE